MEETILRPQAEQRYQEELSALRLWDQDNRKPQNWLLSPKAVRLFILGSPRPVRCGGREITIRKKYLGNDALVERCIITLAGNRGLMLVGEPGTAKTMLSELLSAAISGCSTNTVQGTAGTTEDMIKYSWNYALLLAKGPSREALVPSPLYVGMEKGILTRFEEITRTPAEVQDSLISVLSDKVLNIPELGDAGLLFARPGFNVIGTANTRDKGVNEMSSALKRRFNFETVQPVRDVALEKQIILNEVGALADAAGGLREDRVRGSITIGSYLSLAPIMPALGEFAREYPDITFTFLRINSLDYVDRKNLDALFCYDQSDRLNFREWIYIASFERKMILPRATGGSPLPP